MKNEKRMYVAVEAREDFIYVDGNESKFYPHPVLEGVYASRLGQIARKRIVSGKVKIVPTRKRKDGYVDCNVNGISKLVHVIVLETFVNRPDEEQDWVVDHISDVRSQNNIENLQWLTRTENLKKRDEAGSLYKNCFAYDRVTDLVTEYESRLAVSKALNIKPSNVTCAIQKETVMSGRYLITDSDYLLPEDYYYIFKEYDLKKELVKNRSRLANVKFNKIGA